jgi:NMD protein affecting ribosome stability and mRNA decay
MSDDYDGGYSNGADGTCQECGAETDQEWHALCMDCWREEHGHTRPARPEPGEPPRSFVEGLAQVREHVRALEDATASTFDSVEARLAALEARLESKRAA